MREAFAAAGSSAVLASLALGAGWAVVPAFGCAAATWLGLRLMLPADRREADENVAPGVTRADHSAVVGRLGAAEESLRARARELPGSVAVAATDLADVLADLRGAVQRDPRDVPQVAAILESVVDRVVGIVAGHARIVASARRSGVLEGADSRLVETLTRLSGALAELHRRLLEDDLRELAIDQRIVEELLSLERGSPD